MDDGAPAVSLNETAREKLRQVVAKIERLEENARALEIDLSAADIQALEAATPPDAVKGTRYAEGGMAVLSR